MASERRTPLVLEVARMGLEIRPSDPAIPMVVGPAHVPFLAECAGEDCATVVLGPASGRSARRPKGKTLFDAGSVWRVEETGEGHLLTLRSPLFGREPYLSVEFDREYRRGEGETLQGGPHLEAGMMHPFVYPFDEVVFLARLARGRGVLVHGCGISYQERGLLFLGTPGAGKSTTAGLWKERPETAILSDDRVIIRADGSGFRIFGTPGHAEDGLETTGSAPLEAVFILEQAARNGAIDVSAPAAVAQMMVRASPAMWDQQGLEFAVRFLAGLSERIPVRRLQFLPERSAVEYVVSILERPRDRTR